MVYWILIFDPIMPVGKDFSFFFKMLFYGLNREISYNENLFFPKPMWRKLPEKYLPLQS